MLLHGIISTCCFDQESGHFRLALFSADDSLFIEKMKEN